jgi:hypothetical protein
MADCSIGGVPPDNAGLIVFRRCGHCWVYAGRDQLYYLARLNLDNPCRFCLVIREAARRARMPGAFTGVN